jgi:hypothetical protein
MGAVSNQQIYDLLLEVADDLASVEASVDEILLNMRTLNQELEAGQRLLAEQRAHFVQQRALLK